MKHAWTVLCPVCDEGKLSSRSLSNERERETDLRRDLPIGRVREPVVRQGHGSCKAEQEEPLLRNKACNRRVEEEEDEEEEELKRQGFGSCLLDRGAAEEARGRRRQENMKRTSKAFFLEVCSITTSSPSTSTTITTKRSTDYRAKRTRGFSLY
jgi:hypothetical protein